MGEKRLASSVGIQAVWGKSHKEHVPEHILDNNPNTYWQSIPYDGESYERMYDHYRYLEIVLDGLYELEAVQVWTKVDGSYSHYYIYASEDGRDYQKIVSKTDDTPSSLEGDRHVVNVRASRLRINMAYHSQSVESNLVHLSLTGHYLGQACLVEDEIQIEQWQGSSWQEEWERFETDSIYARQKVLSEMRQLVGRVLGEQWQDNFIFEMVDIDSEGDWFSLSDAVDGRICIQGNQGLSLASGFNYYLRHYIHIDYTPLFASQTRIDDLIPVGSKQVHKARFATRYLLNFTAYSYTMAFWTWEEYQAFLDWAAMNGVNLILDLVGQEEVIRQTLTSFSYTDDDVREYLPGPAYFAWFYMQNLYAMGGPLSSSWFVHRVELGRRIHDRMQVFGMKPVLQGFAGQVPVDFQERYPDAVLTPADSWVGYTRPSMLKTYLVQEEVLEGKKDYFSLLAQQFYACQKSIFGSISHYYAVDPFHEGGDVGDLDLAHIYQHIQKQLLTSDKDAIWVMQQWQGNLDQTRLSLLDRTKILALDLQTDMRQEHQIFEEMGIPWVYNVLHNFGGRMGLDGNLPLLSTDPMDLATNRQYMVGIGVTAEAFENSPIIYQLLFDTNWSSSEINLKTWLRDYAHARAGGLSLQLEQAWDGLLETVYRDKGTYYQGAAESIIQVRPTGEFQAASTWGHMDIFYEQSRLDEVLADFLRAPKNYLASPAYCYDLAQVADQVLHNGAYECYKGLEFARKAGDISAFEALSHYFLSFIDMADRIASTTEKTLLGRWLKAARRVLPDADDWTKDLFEMNARTLITTWGGKRVQSLKDYSNRKWSGLTRDFYGKRWKIWLSNRLADLKGLAYEEENAWVEEDWYLWEARWTHLKSDDLEGAFAYSPDISDEDLFKLAQDVLHTYSYTAYQNRFGKLIPEPINVALGLPVFYQGPNKEAILSCLTNGTTGHGLTCNEKGWHLFELVLPQLVKIEEIQLAFPQLAKDFPYCYRLAYFSDEAEDWIEVDSTNEGSLSANLSIRLECVTKKIRLKLESQLLHCPLSITEIRVLSYTSP